MSAWSNSADERLAAIAAKAVKETRYHCATAPAGWCGSATARRRATHGCSRRSSGSGRTRWNCSEEDGLDREMADSGIGPRLAEVRPHGRSASTRCLAEATLERPRDRPHSWFGKRGEHSEHFGYMLAEMQYLQRAYPGARW